MLWKHAWVDLRSIPQPPARLVGYPPLLTRMVGQDVFCPRQGARPMISLVEELSRRIAALPGAISPLALKRR